MSFFTKLLVSTDQIHDKCQLLNKMMIIILLREKIQPCRFNPFPDHYFDQ